MCGPVEQSPRFFGGGSRQKRVPHILEKREDTPGVRYIIPLQEMEQVRGSIPVWVLFPTHGTFQAIFVSQKFLSLCSCKIENTFLMRKRLQVFVGAYFVHFDPFVCIVGFGLVAERFAAHAHPPGNCQRIRQLFCIYHQETHQCIFSPNRMCLDGVVEQDSAAGPQILSFYQLCTLFQSAWLFTSLPDLVWPLHASAQGNVPMFLKYGDSQPMVHKPDAFSVHILDYSRK